MVLISWEIFYKEIFYSNIMPLLSVIMNKISLFSHFELCFEMYACLIFLFHHYCVKKNRNNEGNYFLFDSKLLQDFYSFGKIISFYLYWSIRVLSFFFFMVIFLYDMYLLFLTYVMIFLSSLWFSATMNPHWKHF